jgi:hypothetical protein
MATLSDEQPRALLFSRSASAAAEARLGADQPNRLCGACQAAAVGGPQKFRVKITEAGRKALAE